ncbi:MAG: class I SAM-dependent methyltransferase [Chloroflexi bacterium]|nr:class I SAM-dependent methyltransferase [Chloroflexota bacterium]
MPHKFDPQHMHVLESAERRRDLDPDRVFALLPVAAGQTIADIGCGPGFFTLPLARKVGAGRVYAIDVQEEMLARVRERLAQERVSNVEVVRSEDSDLRIPKASLDGAFMACVLHEAEDRGAFLEAVREALKPGGWAAVIEWQRREMPEGPPLRERLSPRQVRLALGKAGLTSVKHHDLSGKHYLVLARRL